MDPVRAVVLAAAALPVVGAVALGCLVTFVALRAKYEDMLHTHFPRPPRRLLWGNLLDIRQNPTSTTFLPVFKVLLKWAKELGDIFYVRLLFYPVIVVCDPDLCNEILRGTPSRPRLQKHPSTYNAFNRLNSASRYNILSSPETPYWKAVRRAIAPAFSSANIRQTFPKLLHIMDQACCSLEAYPPTLAVDIDITAQKITLGVIAAAGFDRDAGAMGPTDHLLTVVQHTLQGVQLHLNPLTFFTPLSKDVRVAKHWFKEFDTMVGGLLDDMQRAPPAPHTIAAHLLQCRDPATGNPLTREQLKAELSIIMVAGFETTAHSISWTLGLVAAHPEVDAKVVDELDRLGLVGGLGRSPPRQLQWEDLAQMPYVTAVAQEGMRMLPVAASGTSRLTDRDMEIGGYHVRKHTTIWMPFYAFQRQDKYWPAADQFLPERWLAADPQRYTPGGVPEGSVEGSPRKGMPAGGSPRRGADGSESEGLERALEHGRKAPAFMPFSIGPRDCVGQPLAMLEFKVALALLLARFRFELPPEVGGCEGLDRRGRQFVTMKPMGGLPLYVHPRV